MRSVIFGFVCAALFLTTGRAERDQGCNGATVSVPDDFRLVCSATWQFEGKCVGRDMWDKWTITGRTNPSDSFIRPFEDVPITIVGYELLKLHDGERRDDRNNRLSWFMIGSAITAQPDAMIWLGPGESRVRQMWPAGMGQLWPPKGKAGAEASTDKIDLHGVCFGGDPVTIFGTVYYAPRPK
jgi:hypothetical protein